jgi:acetolactate synthase-1/2/3 large subunit
MKVSDVIAKFLKENLVDTVFSVTGGYAMHLNDSFGNMLTVSYHNGEINCGYAAIGWSSIEHKPCVVCTTAGCGATNAITPCLSAWHDSVPVFFINGAINSNENIRSLNNCVRTFSGSDGDIITMVKDITKFSYELVNPSETTYILSKCLWNMTHGRKGPVWLSVPLDVQNMEVSENIPWVPPIETHFPPFTIPQLENYKRPVFIIGSGIRECVPEFIEYANMTGIPFVVSFMATDVPGYVGRLGVIGDRNGNKVVQDADLVVSLGCRLGICAIGYKGIQNFAPQADIYQVDIDTSEFRHDRIKYIHSSCKNFISKLPRVVYKPWFTKEVLGRQDDDELNPYNILDEFFRVKPGSTNIVCSSGSLVSHVWHTYVHKYDDRFIICSNGDMGFEIPASIGVAMKTNRRTFCMVGDGSFQFSFTELMNVKNLPITFMVFNNGGYGAIKLTQKKYFKNEFGTDFKFPDVKKIADVYNIPYYSNYTEHVDGPCIIEIKCKVQDRLPMI